MTSLIGALILLHCAPLYAYVMPGLQLIDLMNRHMGMADSLAVTQRVECPGQQPVAAPQNAANPPRAGTTAGQGQAPPEPKAAPPSQWEETLSYRAPGSFRVEDHSGKAHRILVISGDAMLTIRDGYRLPKAEGDRLDRYVGLLCCRSMDTLQAQLTRCGVDVGTSSIGRFQGKPCWVLGAQYPALTASQVWIEKEHFLPLRWVIPHVLDDGSLRLVEFRFLKWKETGTVWYPMEIQVMEGNKLVRDITVERVQVNPSLDGKIFDIDTLKHLYPVSNSSPTRSEPPEDIQRQPQ